MYSELVERTWSLADLMMRAANEHLHVTTAVANEDRELLNWVKDWAGGEPEKESRAGRIGPTKALETLVDPSKDFVMTPCHVLGTGWMGGVRRRVDEVHYVTASSAWAERCDAMVALLLNYAMTQEVRFHHVGSRYPTEESALKSVRQDQAKLGVDSIVAPAEDHLRWYLPVHTEAHPKGKYWIEHQYWPGGPYGYAIHWDLATMNPLALLSFVATNLGLEAKTWKADEGDPVGVVWVKNRNGIPYGIMARSRWTEPG